MLIVDAQIPAKRPSTRLAGITSRAKRISTSATEAAAFLLLMMTTVLPLFNGANAVLQLIRSTGGAF
jgi:hypothetical protein